jgi:hypothetical protein
MSLTRGWPSMKDLHDILEHLQRAYGRAPDHERLEPLFSRGGHGSRQ